MPTVNDQDTRNGLFGKKDSLLRAYHDALQEAHHWGALCKSASILANLLVPSDKESSRFLIDLAARAGKRGAGANIKAAALDRELSLVNRAITHGDALMTWQDLRDEQDARGI